MNIISICFFKCNIKILILFFYVEKNNVKNNSNNTKLLSLQKRNKKID